MLSLSEKADEMLGESCNGLASDSGGVTILLVASCYRKWDKLGLSVGDLTRVQT